MGFIDTLTTKGPIEDSRIDYFPDAVPRDCLLYLPLARNRLRGDTFRSLDSYRHPCTVTGAVWTPQGRKFDGIDDTITAAPAASSSYSIGFWMKSYQAADFDIFYRSNAGGRWYVSTSTVALFVRWQHADASYVTYTITPIRGWTEWSHIAACYDGVSILYTYVDGQLVSSTNVGTLMSWSGTITFGYADGISPGSNYYAGLMDEIFMFNSALTAQEIQRLYLATKDRYQ